MIRYVLKIMTLSPQKGESEYLYFRFEDHYTTKLSQATTWHNTDVIEHIIEDNGITDYKIISMTEKELFEARLKE